MSKEQKTATRRPKKPAAAKAATGKSTGRDTAENVGIARGKVGEVDAKTLEKFKELQNASDALFMQMGKLEVAKIELAQNISEIAARQNALTDSVFAEMGLDPKGSYDLDFATGVITRVS